jgi:tetratricopeptide (TPR) repeat protein/predicted Ser/Thr protein kinase
MEANAKTDRSGRLNRSPGVGDPDGGHMGTSDQALETDNLTVPPEIAALGVEKRQLYDRVREKLGLGDGRLDTETQHIGRYQIQRRIGRGGMGVVFVAHDPRLDRNVAIKLVSGRPMTNAQKLRSRLLREAQILAKLRHPNVVGVYDSGEHEDEVFLAMEYVEGDSLREWQRSETRTLRQLLSLYIEAGRGLAAAHDKGIIHRDFKPDNVFVAKDGHARVGDFGLAGLLAEPDPLDVRDPCTTSQESQFPLVSITQTGELLGTLGYMAPEQVRGGELDDRSDQFAFCVSLWESVTAVKPFGGRTRREVLEAMERREPQGAGDMPPWLRRVLRTGLAAEPGQRHPSMATLVRALEAGVDRRSRWLRRGGLVLAISIGAVGSGAVFFDQAQRRVCSHATEIADVRGGKAWLELRERVPAATADELDSIANRLQVESSKVCRLGNPAQAQRLERAIHRLEGLTHVRPEGVHRTLDELQRSLVDDAAPEPITDSVFALLLRAEQQGDEGGFDEAIATASEALRLSKSAVDRTEALLVLGRLRMFSGDHSGALRDFHVARNAADAAAYDDARLRANLLATRTIIMRQEQIELGEEYLEVARAILERRHEPQFSLRRTELLELEATVSKRRGRYDEAASTMRSVVARRVIHGTRNETATALVGLGTVEEFRGRFDRAELLYRLGLIIVPGELEASHNLGRLLVNLSQKQEEARRLLEDVAQRSADLRLTATTSRLQLALGLDEPDDVDRLAVTLEEQLESGGPGTPRHRIEAWMFLALAHARRGSRDAALTRAVDHVQRLLDDPTSAEAQLEMARLELSVASTSLPNDVRAARRYATKGVERLMSLPESPERASLIQYHESLLTEIGAKGGSESD